MENRNDKLQFAYILPNLFTAASAFLGVVSIAASAQGNFTKAAALILVSLVFDGLDGRIARLTNTSSKFGVEFDSLADVIAFGVAPAMFFYFLIGDEYGRMGVVFAAIFAVFGAVRLARFNVMSPSSEPTVFIGVPIPTAAVLVVSWGIVFYKYDLVRDFFWVLFALQALASILMVSNIRYPSFKKVNIKKTHMIKVLIILIAILSFIFFRPFQSIAFLSAIYVLYGLVRYFYNVVIAKIRKNKYNSGL